MQKVPIIVGDSHGFFLAKSFGDFSEVWDSEIDKPLKVMQDGAISAEYLLLGPRVQFFMANQTALWINPAFAGVIDEAKERWSRCLLSIEGNQHNSNFLLAGPRPFDFHDPGMADRYVDGRQILPRSTVIGFFERCLSSFRAKIELLQAALGSMPIDFVAPPPPIPSESHIRDFPEAFDFTKDKLNDPLVRLKLYRAYIEVLSGYCAEAGVRVMLPPPCALDEVGFLRREFWNHCTHATPEYYQYLVQENSLEHRA